MTPSTASPWHGPRAPRRRRVLPGDTYTTLRCSTEPPPGRVSHQQPPACASMTRFAALPENVWSELHQRAGSSRAAYTLSDDAAVCAVSRISKPLPATPTTSAVARSPTIKASAHAAVPITSVVFCAIAGPPLSAFRADLERPEDGAPAAGRIHGIADFGGFAAHPFQMPMLQFNSRHVGAFGNELHLNLGDEVGVELPFGVDLPCQHQSLWRLPRNHVSRLARRTVFSDGVPATADARFDDALLQRRLENRMRRGPPARHFGRKHGKGARLTRVHDQLFAYRCDMNHLCDS